MMYTVVPAELLEWQTHLPARHMQTVQGGYAELWQDGSICRLISTDPSLYLDPHFAPGKRWRCRSSRPRDI